MSIVYRHLFGRTAIKLQIFVVACSIIWIRQCKVILLHGIWVTLNLHNDLS